MGLKTPAKGLAFCLAVGGLGVIGSTYLVVPPLSAQEIGAKEIQVQIGEYQHLTPLRALKLGASAYVRPDIYKEAAVAYTFDMLQKNTVPSPALVEALKSGEAWVGSISDSGDLIVQQPTAAQLKTLAAIASSSPLPGKMVEMWDESNMGSINGQPVQTIIVSPSQNIAGLKAVGAYVAWKPGSQIDLSEFATGSDEMDLGLPPAPSPE